MLKLEIQAKDGTRTLEVAPTDLVIAGWTGRDKAAMEAHIAELEELGVKRPETTPVYYRASVSRLTTAKSIEAVGGASSGEVEFVLFASGGEVYVGCGSDHTDRVVETYGVTVSKQICDKPVSHAAWPLSEVADHWDQLNMRSWATIGGERLLYQEGTLAQMLHWSDLVRGLGFGDVLPDGAAMFGGTFGAIGGVRPAERFEGELEDPVLGRKLGFSYGVRVLPIRG